ncbi:hypothetical protein C1N71_13200 [Agrococcus sp. SGAir0287]|nr:hypothetical protein C1N71_13200 [Agrococcus sp. SGAir0287]
MLDEEANAVLAAIARSARPTKASAVADDPNLLNGIDGANQRRPVRTVPFWAAVTSMAVGVIVGASFLWLGIEWTGQAESIRDAVIDIELQIEELQ